MTERSSDAASQRARQLLHKRVKVQLVDGRTVTGNLVCMDKQENVVLQHTCQSYNTEGSQSADRQLGMVIIPKHQRKSCQVEAMPQELDALKELLGISGQ